MKTKLILMFPKIQTFPLAALLLLLLCSPLTMSVAKAQATPDPLINAKKRIDKLVQDSTKLQQAQTKLSAENKIVKSRNDSLINVNGNPFNSTYRSTFVTGNWFIYSIGSVLSIALIIIILTKPKDSQFPLGLPDGSIRAIIAILAIILYVLISLVLAAIPSSVVATDVTKTLGTLVVAISAFYFGSKTAEQSIKTGSDINVAAAKAANDNNCNPTIAPLNIIKQAIDANKTEWLKLYNAQDILIGKKKSNETTNNVDCILFKVTVKLDSPEGKSIPPLITYVTDGKTYKIPTDVQASATVPPAGV